MKTALRFLIALSCALVYSFSTMAQNVTITAHAIVGIPGNGNNLLTFNTERSWIFRQFDTGPSTALELYSSTGLKNFVINSTGNVGIDVLLPTEKLHVNGSIKAIGPRISFGSAEYIADGGGFIIECNGALISSLDGADDLGSSARRWKNLYATNGVINTSDANNKTNIQSIAYGLRDIMKLRPVSFEWKDRPQDGPKLGLIAQDVQKVIGEVVVDYDVMRDEVTGESRKVPAVNLGIYYSDLIPVLIKSIQEQQNIIVDQQQKIIALEANVKAIQKKMANK